MSGILRAAGAAVLSLALLAPTAALADRWSSTDEAGDVEGRTYDPEPTPCGTDVPVDASAEANTDITRLSVRHARRAMVITAKFDDLDPTLEQMMFLYVRAAGRGWWIDIDRFRTRNGSWRLMTFMSREPRLPDPDDVDGCGIWIVLDDIGCRTTPVVDTDRDLVRLTVPRRCMGNPRWLRVAASAYRFVEPEDPDSQAWTTFSDDWDNGGTALSPWMPPFGPRVPATEGAQVGANGTEQASTGERRQVVVRRDGIFARR